MTEEIWSKVDDYYAPLVAQDDALDSAVTESEKAGLPSIQVAPNQGKLLHLLAKIRGAKSILEVGTLGGYSTIWLARALPKDGKLITLEIDPKHAEVAKKNIARADIHNVEVRVGKAIDSLAAMKKNHEGPFDLTFIDADKPSNLDYFLAALEMSKPGSVIVIDNVVRAGRVTDGSSTDVNVVGVRRMRDALAKETRVSTTVLQTVGVKGYDGLVVALVL